MNQGEILELINRWEQTDQKVIKLNIYRECTNKYGGRRMQLNKAYKEISEKLNVSVGAVKSYMTNSHKAKVEFKRGLQLAEILETHIENFLENN